MIEHEIKGNIAVSSTPNINKAQKWLLISVQTWFVVALIGQLIFVYYIIVLYGGATFSQNWEAWNTFMPHGYAEGKSMSNITVMIHVFLAAVITLGGPIQIIPQIRNRFPSFHRWNGRVYVLTAVVISITGIMINLLNKPLGSQLNANLTAFNGILIITFSLLAWKTAILKQFIPHRKWALRLFMAASGVWFYRIGLMFWLLINSGPVGFDPETFTGPALTILNAAQFVIPLAVLELYFWVSEKGLSASKWLLTALMVFLISITITGIFGAAMGLWFPYV